MTDVEYTRNIYNKFSEEYHKHISNPENLWHHYIEKPVMVSILKKIVKNKKVLDLGCGSGTFTKKIYLMGAKVIGLDVSKKLIEIARKDNPKIKFYVGDAKKTPFKKSEFDVVSSSLMIHYFKELNPLFREVSKVLKKNVYFVFSMHHPVMEVSSKLKRKESLLKPYFRNNKYNWILNEKMKMIAYHHTFEMIINSLNDTGFVVERLYETKSPKKIKKINKKIYEKATIRPSFLIIKARKIV
jgi:ubiquinone/menaquinone biosynthesis C-methylase UbiE